MIRRLPAPLALAATVAIAFAACNGGNGGNAGPPLTDPAAIVTAALKASEAAKSVHLDLTADGTATIALPIPGSSGTPIDLTGTTASADLDLANTAAKATFSVPSPLKVAGELIAVGGTVYMKTSLTGTQYQASAAGANVLLDPSKARGLIDNLGDLLLKPGVDLAKGDDVACGSKQCYTVTADLTAAALGPTGASGLAGLPVDLDRRRPLTKLTVPGREGPPVPPCRGVTVGPRSRRTASGTIKGCRRSVEMGRAGHDPGAPGRPGEVGPVTAG